MVRCCAEDSVYDTPIDPLCVALRVLRVAGDHTKLRQPQQLSHTAICSDKNFRPNVVHRREGRESESFVRGAAVLDDRDPTCMRKGHAEGPQFQVQDSKPAPTPLHPL